MIIKAIYSIDKKGFVTMYAYSSEDMKDVSVTSKAYGQSNIATAFAKTLREFPSTYKIVGEKEIRQSCSCADFLGLLNAFREKGFVVDDYNIENVGMIYIYGGV